jgi:hypothetical protein
LLVCGLALCAPAWAAKPPHEKAVAHASKKGAGKAAAASPARRSPKHATPANLGISPKQAKGKHAPMPLSHTSTRAASDAEPAPRAVIMQKAPLPVRTEMGCSDQGGALLAVGQVMKSDGKTYRCQSTWDYADGKLVGYPAWVELFMPTPSWGAGLRETPPPPADALAPALQGGPERAAPQRESQDETAAAPAAPGLLQSISNFLF